MKQPVRVSPLEGHLGYWLRFVSNHVSHAFARKLEGRGVTVAEWVVLRDMYGRGAAPAAASELAAAIGITRGAVSKLVDRLEAKALVARTPDKHDRRYQALALTRAGQDLVPQLAGLADRNDAEFFGHLGPKQRAAIERAMQDIVRRHGLRTMPLE